MAGVRSPYRIRVPLGEAIRLMIAVLGQGSEPILLVSSVDELGDVGPGDCFSLEDGPPSQDLLAHFISWTEAPGVLFGSRATRSVFDPDEFDLHLHQQLLSATEAAGATLVDHLLVKGDIVRVMKKSGGLG